MIVLIGRFFAKINEYIHLDTLVECTCSNPSVAMLCNLGGGGKYVAISTFAPFFSNGKWKVENGKILSPLLRERIEHSTQSVVSVLGEGSSRRVKLTGGKKPILQSWHCQYKLGSGV